MTEQPTTASRHPFSMTTIEMEAIAAALAHARDTYTDRKGNPLMRPAALDNLLHRLHAELRAIRATDYGDTK